MLKRPRCGAQHSLPSSAEFQNSLIHLANFLCALLTRIGATLLLVHVYLFFFPLFLLLFHSLLYSISTAKLIQNNWLWRRSGRS